MKVFNRRWRCAAFLILCAWCLAACQPGDVERVPPAESSTEAVLPVAGDLDGWEMVTEAEHYGPENLWDYINGQAEFYLNYGFLRVDTAEYRAVSGAPSVVVEVYRMAGSEEAFGIYAAERVPEDRPIEIGSGGYLGSNALNFWQGQNYIKLISFEAGPATEDALMVLARRVSESIPTGSGAPEIFDLFPEEGRIENSERFFPRGFLGQAHLDRAFRVDYRRLDGESYQLFLVRLESDDEARAALDRYADFLSSEGRDIEYVEGESAATVSESGAATVVFVRGEFFGGALDATTLERGSQVANELASRLATVR